MARGLPLISVLSAGTPMDSKRGYHMKTGKSLVELATEIERQNDGKADFLASTNDLAIVENGDKAQLAMGDNNVFDVGATAHAQIAEEAGIPKPYYDRMLAEDRTLLANNVNRWFKKYPKVRMLRTLDNKARALLSDRFRKLDNYDLAEVALPALQKAGLEIVSSEITESKLYIKAVDQSVKRHIPVGHKMGDGSHVGFKIPSGDVVPALQISNSEIGHGSLSVVAGYLDGGCTNLCWWWKQGSLRKYHVGARLDVGDEIFKLLTDETRSATDKAVWMQFRDTLKAAINPEIFDQRLEAIVKTIDNKIEGDVPKIIELTAKKFTLNDTQKGSVLRHLIQGGDLSQFGLMNAVTRTAEDQEDYDEATRLENLGGKIIELAPSEWRELQAA